MSIATGEVTSAPALAESDAFAAQSHRALNPDEDPSIRGTVREASGEPCAEPFEVRLTREGEAGEASSPLRVVFSDGSGSFEVWSEPGTYLMEVRHPRAPLPRSRCRWRGGRASCLETSCFAASYQTKTWSSTTPKAPSTRMGAEDEGTRTVPRNRP